MLFSENKLFFTSDGNPAGAKLIPEETKGSLPAIEEMEAELS